MSKLIRVTNDIYEQLVDMEKNFNSSKQSILKRALTQLQREKLLNDANIAYIKLQSDPQAWADELAEREMWDITLSDGLEED